MKADNYAPVHASVLVVLMAAFVLCIGIGLWANIPEIFGAGIGLIFAAIAIVTSSMMADTHLLVQTRYPDPEPTLYRYEVERLGFKPETVYAADVYTDDIDAQTVHFTDHEGTTNAIYSHVLKVEGWPVESEED